MAINEIIDTIYEGLKMPLEYVISPNKRIYFLYLFTSVVLAFFIYNKSHRKTSFLRYLFKKKVWLSRSAFIDYYLSFVNGLVKVVMIAPILIIGPYLSFHTENFLIDTIGDGTIMLAVTPTIVLYTLTIVIVGDFASFFTHYLMHKVPFLWEFHKTHHSATVLNPVTQYRIHPVELIINNVRGLVVFGLVTGTFEYLCGGKVSMATFLGINVLNFAFLFFGANLRHSHVQLKYFNFLEYILISPYQHQIHHSNNPTLFNKNMGAKFAIWDWMFGTLVRSESVTELEFGLGSEEDKKYDSLWKNLINPFKNIFAKLIPKK